MSDSTAQLKLKNPDTLIYTIVPTALTTNVDVLNLNLIYVM